MDRLSWRLTVAVTLLTNGMILVGCASQRQDRLISTDTREQVMAVARQREAELSTLRAEMAATRIAAARKEAELVELRALVAQLRQEHTDSQQQLLELRQTVEMRQSEMNSLKAERDQLLVTKNDQSLKDLREGLMVLTKQLEDVRQDIGHSSLRPSEKGSKPSTRQPAAPARQDLRPADSVVQPSMLQADQNIKPMVTMLAVSPDQSFEPVIRVRVEPGDSLSSLARVHHTSVATIRQLNHLTKDVIAIGQELLLPSVTGSLVERER